MRRGITPVVAIALLLGMTVTASGGAYAWITQTTTQAQSEASAGLAAELVARDVQCHGSTVITYLKNNGGRSLMSPTATAYLYVEDELLAERDMNVSGKAFRQPGGLDDLDIVFSGAMDNGRAHRLVVTFPQDDVTVSASCTARSDLVAYWPLDAGSGTTANDLAGSNDGAVFGASWTADGIVGGALDFDEEDNVTFDRISPEDFTISLWLRPDDSGQEGRHIIKSFTTTGGNADGYLIQLWSGNGIHIYQAVDGDFYAASPSAGFPHDGAYHHVAMTMENGTSDVTTEIYIDGARVATGNGAGSPTLSQEATMNLGGNNLNGSIDDVRFYDTALSAERIETLYNATR